MKVAYCLWDSAGVELPGPGLFVVAPCPLTLLRGQACDCLHYGLWPLCSQNSAGVCSFFGLWF